MLRPLNIPRLVERIRKLADVQDSQFFTDDYIKEELQSQFEDLYDTIVRLNQGYFTEEADDLEVVEGNKVYYPEGLYKIRLLEQKFDADTYLPIYEKSLREVSAIGGNYWNAWSYGPSTFGYIPFGNHLKVYPANSVSSFKYKLNYVPEAPDIESARMEKSFINYLRYQTAYILTTIEQNDSSALQMRANEWLEKIKDWAAEKSTDTKVIKDTESSDQRFYF